MLIVNTLTFNKILTKFVFSNLIFLFRRMQINFENRKILIEHLRKGKKKRIYIFSG